jgi:hypothetical protein
MWVIHGVLNVLRSALIAQMQEMILNVMLENVGQTISKMAPLKHAM